MLNNGPTVYLYVYIKVSVQNNGTIYQGLDAV